MEEEEFSMSRDSVANSSSLNASYASSIAAGTGAAAEAKKTDGKPGKPKKKTKLPPKSLTSLSNSFEFDSSFS
jgi:hypothetical protein